MTVIALSLAEEIERFGAYAGLAAFFGLAVLTILYFAQAREVKRLREWAGRAPERAAELEARVAADAARRAAMPQRQPPPKPAGSPATAPAAATAAGAGAAPSSPTVAPAAAGAAAATTSPEGPTPDVTGGNGAADAPSTASAPGEPPAPAQPSPPEPAGDQPGDQEPGGAGEGSEPQQPAEGQGAPSRPPAASPSGGGPAGNGSGDAPVPRATPDPRQPGAAPPPRRPAPAPLRQSGSATRRPAAPPPRRSAAPPAEPERRGPSRTLLAVLGGLAAVVVAVLVATQLFGGEDEAPAPNVPSAQEEAPPSGSGAEEGTDAPAGRSDTTVAVLNGTTVTGLAATIMDKITAAGFTRGQTDNYSDQARSASLVFYADGAREQAQEVARLIDLPAGDVEEITPDIEALAGSQADVVVVVGNDQAQ